LSARVTNTQLLSYCVSNGPRPKLSVGPAAGYPGKRVSHFYVPAIKKYGHLLEDQVLEKAYARAQMFFTGTLLDLPATSYSKLTKLSTLTGDLERTFLVLREKVAIARLEARKNAQGTNQGAEAPPAPGPAQAPGPIPAPGPAQAKGLPQGSPVMMPPPPPPPQADVATRGNKRPATQDSSVPTKKR
jgi:hypothetical protein